MVFASTSEVFGKNPNPPFAEDDDRVLGSTRTARWSYSTSKAMAEHLVFAMHTAYGLPVTVVRYFNVYGPRQNPIFVVSQTIHRILNGRQPLLYDSGDQTRCFTYVDDAIAGTLLAAESIAAIGEAFNIGSMTETTVGDVVDLAIKIANVDSVSGAEAVDTAARYGGRYEDIPRRIPDSTKAQRELGWRLQVDVEEGIRRTIDWARANPWYLKGPGADRRNKPIRRGPGSGTTQPRSTTRRTSRPTGQRASRDLLGRNSSATVHNQKRRCDITEFPTDEATRFLAQVPGAGGSGVVGWRISRRPRLVADQESVGRICPAEFVLPRQVMRVVIWEFLLVCLDGFIRARSPSRKDRVSVEHGVFHYEVVAC